MEARVSRHSKARDFTLLRQEKITSPCQNKCHLGIDHICEGCGRSLQQIENWWRYSEAERVRIIASLRAPAQPHEA